MQPPPVFFPEPFALALARDIARAPTVPALAEVMEIDRETIRLKRRMDALADRRRELTEAAREAGRTEERDEFGGLYRLTVIERKVRTIEPALLKERHPAVFDRIAVLTVSCPMMAAKCVLPNSEIDACSTVRTTERIAVEYEPPQDLGRRA